MTVHSKLDEGTTVTVALAAGVHAAAGRSSRPAMSRR